MTRIKLTDEAKKLINTQDHNNMKDKITLTGILSLINDAFVFGNLDYSTKKIIKSIQLSIIDLEAHLNSGIGLIRLLQSEIKASKLSNKPKK